MVIMSSPTRPPFLPLIRELARTFQAFEQFSGQHVRELGLTPPQFDVIATLGNTPGMNCKELSEKTLITKGTLTGVIDRLIAKGIVCRTAQEADRRSVVISLTQAGDALFQQVFPAHLAHIGQVFTHYQQTDIDRLVGDLRHLRETFATTAITES